jgi:hypothetical protein
MQRRVQFLCLSVCLLSPFSLSAQQNPFVPEDTSTKLVNEISGDIA